MSWLSTPVAAHDLGLSSAPSRVCDEPGGPFLAKGGIRCSSALGVPVAGKTYLFRVPWFRHKNVLKRVGFGAKGRV